MKKTISYIISLITLFVFVLNGFLYPIERVEAADSTKFTAHMVALPGEVLTPDGYLNVNNTGFRVYVEINSDFKPYSMAIFTDSQLTPIDERSFDGPGSYYLSSNTSKTEDLKSLLPEGPHVIKLGFKESLGQDYTVDWSSDLICDYTAALGLFAAEPESPKSTVVIGDNVNLIFTPDDQSVDTSSVVGSIYGRELDWIENVDLSGNKYFEAKYLIAAKDPSATANLTLDDLKITDLAGNVTPLDQIKVKIDFDIDTTIPILSLNSNPILNSVTQGSSLIFEGVSDPGATVLLTINSIEQNVKTTADINGLWSIQFDTYNLEIGLHHALITATNIIGNKTMMDLGNFTVTAKVIQQESQKQIALSSDESSKSDVSPPIIVNNVPASRPANIETQPQEQEVARAGKISASEDTRNSQVNWSAWILLLAMVVLASALATAGYYGYGWIMVRQTEKKGESIRDIPLVKNVNVKKSEPRGTIETSKQKIEPPKIDDDVERPKTRW